MAHRVPERSPPVTRVCPTCGAACDTRRCPNDDSPTFLFAHHLTQKGPVELGERVGEYVVQEAIGRGGHATVYRAERALGWGEVALKVLHLDRAEPQSVSRFYREAMIGAQLSHPNTVRVLDVGQADSGAIFLAMELLDGQTWEARLAEIERTGDLMDPREAMAIAAEVLRGLADAHDQRVVHRDLKPSNVMLAEAGGEPFVKIMDFGIAHVLLSGLTDDGRAVGTPAYMSPEQCSGVPVDGRSDLYALGVGLYRALTGRLPFEEQTALGVMYAHTALPAVDVAIAAPQPLPPGLAQVVMRALAKHPDDRFADARAMREALEAVLDGRVPALPPLPVARAPVAVTPPVAVVPVKRRWLGAAGVAALAGRGVAASLWLRSGAAPDAPPAPPIARPMPASPPAATLPVVSVRAATARPLPEVDRAPVAADDPPAARTVASHPRPATRHSHHPHAPRAPVLPP